MSEERTLSRRTVFRGQMVNLHVDTVVKPDGSRATREIVEHADCVAIIAVDKNGEILLVKQYRQPAGKELLEIPAGGIEPGEAPEDAVRREMQEETGFFPGEVKRLGGFYSAPGYATEYLGLYLARGLTPRPLVAEDTDEIAVVRVKSAEVPGLIQSGRIEDAKSIAGLLLYLRG
ncbi:MAG: NUDIX hydrolase [Chloroflexota bacterium]